MTTTLFNPPKKEKNHHLDCRSRCDVCLDYIHSFFLIFMLKKRKKKKKKYLLFCVPPIPSVLLMPLMMGTDYFSC